MVAVNFALLEFLHQLGGRDNGAHALLGHQHDVVGGLDDLRNEVDVAEAAQVDDLQVEERAQPIEQAKRFGERNVAHLGQRDRQRQDGKPIRMTR